MVSINQTTICILNSIQLLIYNPVASPIRSFGCMRLFWQARNTLNLMMQLDIKPSPCVTRWNPSWSPTAHSSLLSLRRDLLLSRIIRPLMKNNKQLLFDSLGHGQSVLVSHTLWLLLTIPNNKLCPQPSNLQQSPLSFSILLLNASVFIIDNLRQFWNSAVAQPLIHDTTSVNR